MDNYVCRDWSLDGMLYSFCRTRITIMRRHHASSRSQLSPTDWVISAFLTFILLACVDAVGVGSLPPEQIVLQFLICLPVITIFSRKARNFLASFTGKGPDRLPPGEPKHSLVPVNPRPPGMLAAHAF